jgi:hypothetical protein
MVTQIVNSKEGHLGLEPKQSVTSVRGLASMLQCNFVSLTYPHFEGIFMFQNCYSERHISGPAG